MTRKAVFDAFRTEFNTERPHEALRQVTPASVYTPSPRPYPTRLPPLEYPTHCEVRRVSRNGGIRWHNHWVNVSHVLAEEYIAFDEIDDGLWQVYFGPIVLGRFHERLLAIEEINAKGGVLGKQVAVQTYDDQGKTQEAGTAVTGFARFRVGN